MKLIIRLKSFEGHAGRPGMVGGSLPRRYEPIPDNDLYRLGLKPEDFWDDFGIASIPLQRGEEKNYYGFTRYMKPREFRQLAMPMYSGHPPATEWMLENFKNGKVKFAPSVLFVGWDRQKHRWQVTQHEGRHRAEAFEIMFGNVPMPVQLILDNNMRTPNVTERMRKAKIHSQRDSGQYYKRKHS